MKVYGVNVEFNDNEYCCGVLEMGNISIDSYNSKKEAEKDDVYYEGDLASGLDAAATLLKDSIKSYMSNEKDRQEGLVVCTTTEERDFAAAHSVLRRAGFRIVNRFINPKTGNTVLVHHLVLSPAKPKK